MNIKYFVLSCGLFCIICSCGFKGPLYLPKKPVASKPVTSGTKGAQLIPSMVQATESNSTESSITNK